MPVKLPNLPLLVLDTETTGFVPKVHRVIEYASIAAEKGKVVHEYEQLLSLPEGYEIPDAVQVLTRIYPEDLIDKPQFGDILPKISAMVTKDTVIVGQNIKFDLGMLRGEGWDLAEQPWIDTAMLASIVFPELESFSLGYVSKALKLNHDPPHRALGDVRATVEFLSKCFERFESLPKAMVDDIKKLAAKGPEGYRRFFESIEAKGKTTPEWLEAATKKAKGKVKAISFDAPEAGTVRMVEEPLDPNFPIAVITGLKGKTWFAVKNIEATSEQHAIPKDVSVMYPPEFILSQELKEKFLAQDTLSTDELTLAIKLVLSPAASVRSDLRIHGEEYSVFTARLAGNADGAEYKALLKKASTGPAVISHQQLLLLAADADHPIPEGTHVIIDDASMLEDTATTALGWTCALPHLRAAAEGDIKLTKCADLIELWAERVRNGMDLRYLAPSDFDSRDCIELKGTVEKILETDLSAQVRSMLEQLMKILSSLNLAGRIVWIEAMKDGSKFIKSVPEDIAQVLQESLYAHTKTTLLIPPVSADSMQMILPPMAKSEHTKAELTPPALTLSMPVGITLDSVFRAPTGKTILPVGSKRTIEDLFTKHTERLDEDGVTLICQGFSGGHGRMQAEFLVAKAPTVLIMTPWSFEGIDLPPDSADRLILQTLPFDHPSHAIVSRRALRYQDPFTGYSLPRLKHRLFRLLRTFARHAKPEAGIEIIDDRLRTKGYGKYVAAFLEILVPGKTKTQMKGEQMPLL